MWSYWWQISIGVDNGSGANEAIIKYRAIESGHSMKNYNITKIKHGKNVCTSYMTPYSHVRLKQNLELIHFMASQNQINSKASYMSTAILMRYNQYKPFS